jgi:hypothetical protein
MTSFNLLLVHRLAHLHLGEGGLGMMEDSSGAWLYLRTCRVKMMNLSNVEAFL